MDNENINTITPIESINNINPISNINNNPIYTTNNIKNDNNDFVSGLPNWDLIPPYTVVKRVNRI